MDDKLKNPFVFPQLDEFPSGKVGVISGGMTLRDYFAAKAMDSSMSSQSFTSLKDLVDTSYQVADEMLKARKL